MFLVDTNVISDLRRPDKAPPQLVSWAASAPVTDQYLSAMSVYELEVGVRRVERRDAALGERLRHWLDRRVLAQFRDRILPVDGAVAARCAALQVPDPRPERDSFIAATALVHRLVVVTRNVADFEPMGVEILNPWV
ncbi:MAG TPA: type II toxin-antitoxin system VapC family toxin [Stellaceae bacterium]|nr:type II toxin-antitoxin system VapC family toxin [Stellaceae bacterium]